MKDSTIIVGFVFGVIGSWLVLALILKYRKADKAVFSAPQ